MDSFHRADWIGLAQALGGMLAVVAAFLVSSRQARHSERLRRLDSLQRLDGLAKLAELASERISGITEDAVRNGDFVSVSGEVMQAAGVVLDALDEASIDDAPSALTVQALVSAKTAARRARAFVRKTDDEQRAKFYFRDVQPLRQIAEELSQAESKLRIEYGRLLNLR